MLSVPVGWKDTAYQIITVLRGSMNHNSIAEADFYIVSNTFQILEYNAVLSRKKPSVQKGDLCYKAFMNQDQTCKYCPLVHASKQSFHVFFDPERHCWMEAVFESLDGHRTAVTCRQIHGQAGTLFHRLQSGKKICRLNKIYTGIL